MKDFIIFIILAITLCAFIGHLEITISPFSVKLPMWHRCVAVILFFAAWGLWDWGERADAYSKGLKRGIEILNEQIKANNENKGHL